ncbi:MAG: LysR family transcriptional regulator [Gammaproteobacteria bacterium]|nr:LysR family transcriptional regulator [Gammaproteobacteria bacterium]
MQIRHLRFFVTLGREGHFGRAARLCHVTQSTLSAAVRQLENEIGAPLIERDKRFKGLTAEGRALFEWATRVVAEREVLQQQIGALRGELAGTLSVGVIPTALPTIGLLTTPLTQRHPKVTLQVYSHTSNDIQRMLDTFELDAGVTYLDNEPLHAVITLPLYRERYILLTPADGPFRGRQSISWREAATTPLCLLTPDMQNRRILDAIFASVECHPNVHAETNSVMTLCSHIRTGVWSSVLPDNFLWVFGTPPGMLSLPLIEPQRTFNIGLVVRKQDPIPPLVDAFVQAAMAQDMETLMQPRHT